MSCDLECGEDLHFDREVNELSRPHSDTTSWYGVSVVRLQSFTFPICSVSRPVTRRNCLNHDAETPCSAVSLHSLNMSDIPKSMHKLIKDSECSKTVNPYTVDTHTVTTQRSRCKFIQASLIPLIARARHPYLSLQSLQPQENLIQDSVHLSRQQSALTGITSEDSYFVEIKDQVQLADLVKECVYEDEITDQFTVHVQRHTSTNKWIASRYADSLSFASTPRQKKRPA